MNHPDIGPQDGLDHGIAADGDAGKNAFGPKQAIAAPQAGC